MKKYIKPDFTNSNLNITSSLAKFLNAPNDKPTIKILDDELNKNYEKIVFICYDGLGNHPINVNLDKNSILRKNIKKTLTSTFPSTTTNATTSLLTNKYPLEHGWFGWSLYFSEYGRNVDIFPKRDSATGEPLKFDKFPLDKGKYYFDLSNTDYEINTVFPPYVIVDYQERNHVFNDNQGFFDNIASILKKKGKQFIYAYLGEPDTTMHEFGVTSKESKELINYINDETEKLVKSSKNTLFIITADHGQVDIEGYVDFVGDEKLMNMLMIYPYLDARAPAFKVKEGMHKEFEEYFKEKYSDDFILYKSEDLIKDNYFGPMGKYAYLLGDYIGVGTFTHKTAKMTPNSHEFKGHHTSLTEEMEVPLIMVTNK